MRQVLPRRPVLVGSRLMPRRLARRLVRLLLLLQGLLLPLPGLMLGLLERMTMLRRQLRQLRHLRHLRLLLLLLLLLLLQLVLLPLLLPGLVHRLLLAPAGIEGVLVHGLQPGLCAAAGLVEVIGEPLASAGSEDAFRRGCRASAAIDSHLGLHGGRRADRRRLAVCMLRLEELARFRARGGQFP